MSRATALLTLAAALSAPTGATLAADASPNAPCADAQYHQLDFWLGDWDVFDVNGAQSPVARAHITRRLEGCVVHELYESTDAAGTRGESFSIFDRTRGLWHQTWVTNRGRLLLIEGGLKDQRVVLQGSYLAADGRRTQIRGFWWPVSEGVRERAETSTNGGRSWQPAFDLIFKPHRS
jgi:hypothetical protein